MGTLGGNLCLDTRCNYYNQNYEWRKAIDFCLKKDGECAGLRPRASAASRASSTDCAPALIAPARRQSSSPARASEVLLEDFYNNDGIDYLKRRPTRFLPK